MNLNTSPINHVVFGLCAAGTLKYALRQIDCQQRVIGLPDDLSFGPINSPSRHERLAWIENELALAGYEEVLETTDWFWEEAIKPDTFPVIWVNLRSASEYAGLLEFLWRVRSKEFRVVDITNVEFCGRRGPFVANSFGEVSPEQMIETRLIDRQASLSVSEIEAYRAAWKQLMIENAPLRVLEAESLISAPVTHFDDLISSHVTDEWKRCVRVVGETLCTLLDSSFHQTGDLVLWARLSKLIDAGVFEYQGDLSSMHDSSVRRCSPRSGIK